MRPRRLDPGDWGERPQPRCPRALWWGVLRHHAEIELGVLIAAFLAAVGFGWGSVLRLVVVALVLSSVVLKGVREMILGQWRRIVASRRLQRAFLEIGLSSRHHRLTPTVIGSSALPGGTVVRVWLPVGLSVDDLAAARQALAEACFVDSVHVERRPGRRNTAEVILVYRTLGNPT